MDDNELREFAADEGGAFGVCDPMDPRWSWAETSFAVDRVVGQPMIGRLMDRATWGAWLAEEIAAGSRGGGPYVEALAEAMREPSKLPPIIVAEHADGRIEIGDGWHRLAIAVRDGLSAVPAVFGSESN